MNKRSIGVTLTVSLIGLSFAGLALAGGGEHKGHRGRPGGAVVSAHVFERLDANKDGALLPQEGEAGIRAVAQEEIEARFKALDANKDGKVTRAEATQAALTRFDRLDGDRNGAVTRAELDASMQRKGKHPSDRQSSDAKPL